MMSAFLRTTSVTEGRTEVLKAYLELIRDLAYDNEDCLEEFMVLIKHQSMLQQCFSLGSRHRIAVQIRAIKQRIQELNNTRKRYNLTQLTQAISDDMKEDFQVARNFAALYTEEAQLVGFEKPKAELLEMISRKIDGRKVVSVVGMGGLGKTTLARKVYDSKEVQDRFVNRAWITVSQSFSVMELLKDLIKQLLGDQSLKDLMEDHQGTSLQVGHCTSHLRDQLHWKRYFVVLDDLWTNEAWNSFQYAFPEHSNTDSCVVVTTRITEVAKVCSAPYPEHIHYLKALEEKDAKQLLLKKIHEPKDQNEHKLLDEILKKCGGLPLAIVTIGGLLANKGINEWKSLRDQLPSQLASGEPSVEALRQVVTLSYNHLPSHLKPCFLYLSLFPEDFEISKKHLVNRWIAEGFIPSGTTTRRRVEDIAESYFYELISRSLILQSKLDVLGDVKTCRVHDIVHDIAVSISRQENHVFLIDEQTSTTVGPKENIRHVSCFVSRKWNMDIDLSRVRSFTLFSKPLEPIESLGSSKFKVLRVLDLGNTKLGADQKDMKSIGLLIHLKYLHFPRWSNVYALLGSVGNLHGLQTLDIRKSNFGTLPKAITELEALRSLRCSRMQRICTFRYRTQAFRIGGIKVPKGVGSLKQLQILEKVDIRRTSKKAIKELGELTQLRKLVARWSGASKEKCKTFCEAVEKLSSLRSLNVRTWEHELPEQLHMLVSFASPLPSLVRLKLKGPLQMIPAWVTKSVNLVKVDLKYCGLKDLEALAGLPNLMQLRLHTHAYSAEKLVFHRDAFPKLRILLIHSDRLPLGINGIKYLPNIKEISLNLTELGNEDILREEVNTHPNHPTLQIVLRILRINPVKT